MAMYAVIPAANSAWSHVIVGVAQKAISRPSIRGWRTRR